jgi:quinol monooxygenase YgiN
MYGLISNIIAQSGQRDELVKILLRGVSPSMPGCFSYVVATDLSDANSIWVTEVWQSKDAHAASLALPTVKTAMSEGRPLIAKFLRVAEFAPVADLCLASPTKD